MATQEQAKQGLATPGPKTVFDFFNEKKDLIAKALPQAIPPDRMISIFTMVLKNDPALMKCTQLSLIGAVLQSVQLGLMPGPMQHAYFIPFNNKGKDEVQFILGYRGLIELINRGRDSGILKVDCVFENDHFVCMDGLDPVLEHRVAEGDRGKFMGVYAIGKNLIVNEKVFVYLTKDEVEKVRKASKAGDSPFSPWQKWYEEMAKKTAIKRLVKILPLSVDIQKQIAADETIKTEIVPDMAVAAKDETVWDAEIAESPAAASQAAPEKTPQPVIPEYLNPGDLKRFGDKAENAKGLCDTIQQCAEKMGKEKFLKILGQLSWSHLSEIAKIEDLAKLTNEVLNASTGKGGQQ